MGRPEERRADRRSADDADRPAPPTGRAARYIGAVPRDVRLSWVLPIAVALLTGCRGRPPPTGAACSLADCRDAGTDTSGDAGSDVDDDVPEVDAGVARAIPRNVVLFIGDGMGAEQQRAARMFKNGDTAPLAFEAFEHTGCVHTTNASGEVTDSAAAATAMATGQKVDNRVISLATPGDGHELPTVVELQQARGKSAALVTTATNLTDATPAAFGAHAPSRYDDAIIAAGYLQRSRPAVLMGGPSANLTADTAAAAGYAAAKTTDDLEALASAGTTPLCGVFDAEAPSLADRTRVALEELMADDDGFFLLVEHEGSDTGGHTNDLATVIDAVLALEAAVEVALELTANGDDTLILVTGDHETGGLTVTETAPAIGVLPAHAYSSTGHTANDVPIFAAGPGADAVAGCFENTRIFSILMDTR